MQQNYDENMMINGDQQQQNEDNGEERHQIWKKNSGYLYDRLLVHDLKWPSLTFQWLPHYRTQGQNMYLQFTIATHTSGHCQEEYINIMEVEFPMLKDMQDFGMTHIQNAMTNPSQNNGQQQNGRAGKIRKIQQFKHEVQANRVRYSESNPSLMASRVDGAPIAIFKRNSDPTQFIDPASSQKLSSYPVTILSDEVFDSGFALEWSQYGLISGDHQGKICIWKDIDHKPQKYQHSEQIQDTKFVNNDIFLTVGDDGNMSVWDLRVPKGTINSVQVSYKEIYCCAVNPVNNNLVLTAGEQGIVKLWDARNYDNRLYHFDTTVESEDEPNKQKTQNKASVVSLQWSASTPTIFASGSQSGKVKIWDMLRIGFQIPKDNSGTEQLLFTHEGHRGQVTDLSWHPSMMLLGSTEQYYNTFQLYQISNCIQDLQFAQDMQYLRMQCLS